jgi:hypothetical protein
MQSIYRINIAKRDGNTFNGQPRLTHHCKIEKPTTDFTTHLQLVNFVDELRRAFDAIGSFQITVPEWQARGRNIVV